MGFRRASSPAPAATVKRLLILTVPAIEQRPVTATDPYVPGGIDCPTPKQVKLECCRRYSSRLRRAAPRMST